MASIPQKQLRRLPHVFSQFLEVPLGSDPDVLIQDTSDCFRFTSNIEDNAFVGKVRAHTVKIDPEMTKVVVRGEEVDKLDVDVWRFRLPLTTQPELASAVVVGRKLIVTVPKGEAETVMND